MSDGTDRISASTDERGVMTITIDRPEKKNALTYAMFAKLAETYNAAAHDADVRVVVLRGTGDAFCSGADLTSDGSIAAMGPRQGVQWMRDINDCAIALHETPKPTIAQVNGVAAGAGANLALGHDLVICGASARFCQIFADRGMSLDFGGTWLLPRLVGPQRARDLAFRAAMVGADEAVAYGMALEVVADDALDAHVQAYAGEIASKPPVALAFMKQGLNRFAMNGSFTEALDWEAYSQASCFGTEDIREALVAWMQKRTPAYKGR